MQGDLISSLLLPLSLAYIMFTLGLGLTVTDFVRVFRYPRAFSVGLLCHFILLPLVGYLVVSVAGLGGTLAVGFMLIAACPTGVTSNLLTFHARGDVALAVSFTAVAGVVSIVSVPLIVAWSLAHFMGAQQAFDFPYGAVIQQVFMVMGAPVALGMGLRAKAPGWAQRWQSRLSKVATLLFVLIVGAALGRNWALFKAHALQLAPLVLVINLGMMGLGFGLSKLLRVPLRQAATVAIESSVQNGALAIVLASSILKNDEMALPGAVYSVLMYAGAIGFVFLVRRFISPLPRTEASAALAALH